MKLLWLLLISAHAHHPCSRLAGLFRCSSKSSYSDLGNFTISTKDDGVVVLIDNGSCRCTELKPSGRGSDKINDLYYRYDGDGTFHITKIKSARFHIDVNGKAIQKIVILAKMKRLHHIAVKAPSASIQIVGNGEVCNASIDVDGALRFAIGEKTVSRAAKDRLTEFAGRIRVNNVKSVFVLEAAVIGSDISINGSRSVHIVEVHSPMGGSVSINSPEGEVVLKNFVCQSKLHVVADSLTIGLVEAKSGRVELVARQVTFYQPARSRRYTINANYIWIQSPKWFVSQETMLRVSEPVSKNLIIQQLASIHMDSDFALDSIDKNVLVYFEVNGDVMNAVRLTQIFSDIALIETTTPHQPWLIAGIPRISS